MLHIHPFPALLPIANKAAQIASEPYDVVTSGEARALVAQRPESFLRVTRPEVDLPPGTSSDDDLAHEAARRNLDRLVREHLLRPQPAPVVLLYRLVAGDHRQIGVVCCCEVEQYRTGEIVRHERTKVDKERERTRHLLACEAHTEPVMLAHRDDPGIEELVRRDVNDRPRFHFVARDGVTHTVWSVQEPEAYVEAFRRVACAYICDGHHRVAAAAAAAGELAATACPGGAPASGIAAAVAAPATAPTATLEDGRFLAVIFPLSHMRILPYHRLASDLNGLSPREFLDRLRGVGRVEPVEEGADPSPRRRGEVGVRVDGRWWRLTFDETAARGDDVVSSLDASVLQRLVLAPILGLGDPRTEPRLDFVGGTHGVQALAEAVDSGRAAVAFAMHPTSMEELLEVSDAQGTMPPKSTWFDPKLRSGLFVHPFGSRYREQVGGDAKSG